MADGGWWCCCDCWHIWDHFDRINSTSIGALWSEQTGNWEIEDATLYEPGTANALVVGTSQVPLASAGQMVVSADIETEAASFTTGDEFYLYAACDSAGAGGAYAKITKIAGSTLTWNVEIGDSSGTLGNKDMTSSITEPDRIRAWLCVDSDGAVKAAIVSTDEFPWSDDGAGPTGRYYALGHNNTGTGGRFDDFYVTELRTSSRICDYCWCPCLDQVPARALKVTFTSCTNRASCLNGEDADLDWTWNAGVPSWDGTYVTPVGKYVSSPQTFTFRLNCAPDLSQDPSHPGKNFQLEITSAQCCQSQCGPVIPLDTSTCSSLNLIFGPFTMSYGELNCYACFDPNTPAGLCPGDPDCDGTYTLVVTER